MRVFGRITVAIGSLAAAVGLVALKYLDVGQPQTLWQITTREPVILTIVAVGQPCSRARAFPPNRP